MRGLPPGKITLTPCSDTGDKPSNDFGMNMPPKDDKEGVTAPSTDEKACSDRLEEPQAQVVEAVEQALKDATSSMAEIEYAVSVYESSVRNGASLGTISGNLARVEQQLRQMQPSHADIDQAAAWLKSLGREESEK
jgi:hypothetical protein